MTVLVNYKHPMNVFQSHNISSNLNTKLFPRKGHTELGSLINIDMGLSAKSTERQYSIFTSTKKKSVPNPSFTKSTKSFADHIMYILILQRIFCVIEYHSNYRNQLRIQKEEIILVRKAKILFDTRIKHFPIYPRFLWIQKGKQKNNNKNLSQAYRNVNQQYNLIQFLYIHFCPLLLFSLVPKSGPQWQSSSLPILDSQLKIVFVKNKWITTSNFERL